MTKAELEKIVTGATGLPLWSVGFYKDSLCLISGDGDICTKEDAAIILPLLAAFYEAISSDEIDGNNAKVEQEWVDLQTRTVGKIEPDWWRKRRDRVLERDGHKCTYCGATDVPLVCDHVIPRGRGGSDQMDNLVAACDPCNTAKGTRTPEEWKSSLAEG